MAQKKTIRKRKYHAKALTRTLSSWRGAGKMLTFVARANPDVIDGSIGIDHLQKMTGQF